MADVTLRNSSADAGREIKASTHYSYMVNGGTLDGAEFATEELVKEGQCLVMDDTSGLYEKYADGDDGGTPIWPAGKSNPIILDESIKFKVDDDGDNPNVTFGQGIVHGAVYSSMCIGITDIFKEKVGGSVRFVD